MYQAKALSSSSRILFAEGLGELWVLPRVSDLLVGPAEGAMGYSVVCVFFSPLFSVSRTVGKLEKVVVLR